MREIREILDRIAATTDGDEQVLATLIDVKGSGYRLPGARMLIDPAGPTVGMVSGGCLDADVAERAKIVRETGRPILVTYDTRDDPSSVFGLRLGCRGVVRVLLELARGNVSLNVIDDCFKHRQRAGVATLISGGTDIPLGSSWSLDGSRGLTPLGRAVDVSLNGFHQALARDLGVSLSEGRSRVVKYDAGAVANEFFCEVIDPPVSLLIFGAGHDAIPLAACAAQLGWDVSVIDHRAAWAAAERFAFAPNVIVSRPEELQNEIFADECSAAVVMNHNLESDREAIARLLGSSCFYIGVMGPRQRTDDLLEQIEESGVEIDESAMNRLYAPVGLDIGAATPEGIALSIVAEIQSVLAGREGGNLRRRDVPIYDR